MLTEFYYHSDINAQVGIFRCSIPLSEETLLSTMDTHRLNSNEGEINKENYLRIDNTKLSAEEVARIIKNRFEL